MDENKAPNRKDQLTNHPTEREKWEADLGIRIREIAVKEREQLSREDDLKLRSHEQKSSAWRNPVFVAIIGAAVAATGNGVITYMNAEAQRRLERDRSEQTRILEMIKTGDPDKAAANLRFLVDAGLVTDPKLKDSMRVFLNKRPEGTGPSLEINRIVDQLRDFNGIDDARPVANIENPRKAKAASAIGRIKTSEAMGTGFLVGMDLLLTTDFVIDTNQRKAELWFGDKNAVFEIALPAVERSHEFGYALYRVKGRPGARYGYLELSSSAPQRGESLDFVFVRDGQFKLVVSETVDCQVKIVLKNELIHLCDSGIGSAGGALISSKNGLVTGVHLGRQTNGGRAIRADVIRKISKLL